MSHCERRCSHLLRGKDGTQPERPAMKCFTGLDGTVTVATLPNVPSKPVKTFHCRPLRLCSILSPKKMGTPSLTI